MAHGLEKCDQWYEKEKHNNYDSCEKELAKWYGCPRQIGNKLVDGEITNDSFWAEREVNHGMRGWEYDICCSLQTHKTRKALHIAEYCDSDTCTYNSGADFCIRSPRHACSASFSGTQRLVLFQCSQTTVSFLHTFSSLKYKTKRHRELVNFSEKLT